MAVLFTISEEFCLHHCDFKRTVMVLSDTSMGRSTYHSKIGNADSFLYSKLFSNCHTNIRGKDIHIIDTTYIYILLVYNKHFINNRISGKLSNIKIFAWQCNINKINTVQYKIQITTINRKSNNFSRKVKYYIFMYSIEMYRFHFDLNNYIFLEKRIELIRLLLPHVLHQLFNYT